MDRMKVQCPDRSCAQWTDIADIKRTFTEPITKQWGLGVFSIEPMTLQELQLRCGCRYDTDEWTLTMWPNYNVAKLIRKE